jgi:hypothetical protein
MIKLKSLTATLAATALVSGIGLAYAQNSGTDATNPGPGAPAATDSQYNSNNSAMSNSSTTTAPADTSTTAPAGTTSSTAPSTDMSTNSSTNASTSADTTTSPDSSMTERAPQADRN